MTLVGAPATPHPSPNVFTLITKRRSLAGSMIGGIPETQEMLDFCAKHNIVADIEMIRADEINQAYERMLKGDVKYRFVMDIASMAYQSALRAQLTITIVHDKPFRISTCLSPSLCPSRFPCLLPEKIERAPHRERVG